MNETQYIATRFFSEYLMEFFCFVTEIRGCRPGTESAIEFSATTIAQG